MSGTPWGAIVGGAMKLGGGLMQGFGARKQYKALAEGMRENLYDLQRTGEQYVGDLRSAYSGYSDLVDLDMDAARGLSQRATTTAQEQAIKASGGRVEGSQMAFDEMAEQSAESQGLLRRSAGDVTDVLQMGAVGKMMDDRNKRKMSMDIATRGQRFEQASQSQLLGAYQTQAQQEQAIRQAEFQSQRNKQLYGIQGQVNNADAQMGYEKARLAQLGAINQAEAQQKGAFLQGFGGGLSGGGSAVMGSGWTGS